MRLPLETVVGTGYTHTRRDSIGLINPPELDECTANTLTDRAFAMWFGIALQCEKKTDVVMAFGLFKSKHTVFHLFFEEIN